MTEVNLDGQKRLEEYVEKMLEENKNEHKETLVGLMKYEKAGCSFEEKSITLAFPIQPWQANRVGNLHGGMICSAFDMASAVLARFYAGENFVPTISLDVKYIRPVKVGDVMLVKVKAASVGRRITQLMCQAYSKESGKLVSTGTAVFMNADTSKER